MSAVPKRLRFLRAIRGGAELEDRLVQLGFIGAALFVAVVGTLFFVQRTLDQTQRQLAELAVPAEVRIAQLESALNAAFRRQRQIASTSSSAELEPLRDRRVIEERLREAGQSGAIAAASTPGTAPELTAHVARFLAADNTVFAAVERMHAVNAAFTERLADSDARVRTLVEGAQSLAGKLRLRYILELRTMAASLARSPRIDLVRAQLNSSGRVTRQTTAELVERVLEVGWSVDDIDDRSPDELNSLAANTLSETRAELERIFIALQGRLARDPELLAQVQRMARQSHELMPEIGDETRPSSLISLCRAVVEEKERVAASQVQAEAAALLLEADATHLHRDIASLVASSVEAASLARTTTRGFSFVVALAGLFACVLAARRISQGIDELTERNRSLTELKNSLTTLNATLDARVAQRTGELSAANGQLKREMAERQKMEVELRLAQKLESLGRLAAGVAHEINTPVQFVSDSVTFVQDSVRDLLPLLEKYTQLESDVARGAATPSQAGALREAREKADLDYLRAELPGALDRSLDGLSRIAAIVRSMKEFAHPDQKETAHVDLNRAIEHTLTIARGEYKMVADVETGFGDIPLVSCHAGEINQVLLNIIVNAAHAIEEKVRGTSERGLIRIETLLARDAVVIRISDTGGGIPEAIRDRVFDPFFTTKEIGKGTGQGLAIARAVIQERQGGSLTFETTVGKGTTFVIRLPVEAASSLAA